MCAAAHGWVYDWQTLIAGFLALTAGGLAYLVGRGQANATRCAAALQITAMNEQTAVLKTTERRFAAGGTEAHCP
jgi:hypothetical protein